MKTRCKILWALLLPLTLFAQADPPHRLILNMTATPAHSMAVTWRMLGAHADAEVQFAAATPGTSFKTAVSRVMAKREHLLVPRQPEAYHYSVVLTGLRPGYTYVYRVGRDSSWSEWNQFTTARDTAAPFAFVWFGDPQDDILEDISRVFRQSMKSAPDAAFWLFSGDLTSEPEDEQFGELFEAPGFGFRTIPSAMVPGNHDLAFRYADGQNVRDDKGKKVRERFVSPLWNAHFTLPQNGIKGFEETSYWFDHQGVRFILMNSNDRLAEQALWMEGLLKSNPNRWTIVSFHHPVYSTGRDRDDKKTREAFQSLFDTYHVDLVLTGHDHTYARSKKLFSGAVVAESSPGTVYIVSASGPKYYDYTSRYDGLVAKSGANIQLYQVFSIVGRQLEYRAYTADGAVHDAFVLSK